MNPFLDSLIQWNAVIQSWGDWLTAPMSFLSFLGNEEFYLLIMPAIYWCWDAAAGLRVGVMLLLSAGINSIAKLAFHSPRPFWYDSKVSAISHERSFGLPSGHSQNAVTVWGTMAVSIRKRWGWILAFTLMFLIGLSRLYLGVHFLHDVLLGWTIGALMLWGLIRLEEPVKKWLASKSLRSQIGIIFIVSGTLILIGALIQFSFSDWQAPEFWEANAQVWAEEGEAFDP
ncbi:MAG: phosphatase PAP2 family protein, partial [Chloroflexota bacterium]